MVIWTVLLNWISISDSCAISGRLSTRVEGRAMTWPKSLILKTTIFWGENFSVDVNMIFIRVFLGPIIWEW